MLITACSQLTTLVVEPETGTVPGIAEFFIADMRLAPGPLPIIAFSDPNDLLSYPLMPENAPPGVRFVDVQIAVATHAFYVPTLGMLTDPRTAHEGYWDDARIIDMIACGHPRTSACATQ